MGSSNCCFQNNDVLRASLALLENEAFGVATSPIGKEKSSSIVTRVMYRKDRKSSISEAHEKYSSNELQPCRRATSVRVKQNSEVSVKISEARSRSSTSMTPIVPHKFSTGVFLEALMGGRQYTEASTPSPSLRKETTWEPIPMTKILSNLWIGNFDDACNKADLKSNGITHVLSLVGHRSPFNWVEHKHYPMNDYGKTELKAVLEEVTEFIERGQKGNNNVLVHCQSGMNRSAVVIIAILMIMNKRTLYRAHRDLKKLRPIIQVNVDYAKQLLKLERELFDGVNSLPCDWMERDYQESTCEVFYKHENLDTSRHLQLYDGERMLNLCSYC